MFAFKEAIPPVGKRTAAFVASAVLAASTVGAPVAFADDSQTGSGETSLVVHLSDTAERGGTGGTGSYANPDTDGDGLGDNLAFTVPIRIDFAALADGTLVGPSASSVYIENESRYSVHVSSLDVDAQNGWNIVNSAASSQAVNSIDLKIGPSDDLLDAALYLDKDTVSTPAKWNMAARATTGSADRLELSTSGHINNVSRNITSGDTFGQVKWYLTPGTAQ